MKINVQDGNFPIFFKDLTEIFKVKEKSWLQVYTEGLTELGPLNKRRRAT